MNDVSAVTEKSSTWRPVQAYAMAGVCLLIGLPIGFFLRGSAAPPPAVPVSTQQAPSAMPGMTPGQMPTMEQLKHMADMKAQPLLEKVNTDPNNASLYIDIAQVYRSAHQFKEAASYFQKSLDIDPKNVDIRTTMADCLYYDGDVDGALAELDKSLSYNPTHAGTLMNVGIIKLKAKNDVNGAIAAWEKLLKTNPNFEQKAAVEHMLAKAKEQAKAKSLPAQKG